MQNAMGKLLFDKMTREQRTINMKEIVRVTGMRRYRVNAWFFNKLQLFPGGEITSLCKYFSCQVNELLILDVHEPAPLDKPGRVYVLFAPLENAYKIGFTRQHTDKRAEEVRRDERLASLEIVHCIECTTARQARDIEFLLHHAYKAKRIKGEWFNLCSEDLNALKSMDNGDQVLSRLLPVWFTDVKPRANGEYSARDRRLLKQHESMIQQ